MHTSLNTLTSFVKFLSAVDVNACSDEQWLEQLGDFSLLEKYLFLDKLYLNHPTHSSILSARISVKQQLAQHPQGEIIQNAALALKLGDGDLEFSTQNGHSGQYYQRSSFSHKFDFVYQLIEQETSKEKALANIIANTALFRIWMDTLVNTKRDVEPYSWALNPALKGDIFAYLDHIEEIGKYKWDNSLFKTCLADALIQRLPLAVSFFPARKEWMDTAVQIWTPENDPLIFCPHLDALSVEQWLSVGHQALNNRNAEIDPHLPLLTSLALKAISQHQQLNCETLPLLKVFMERIAENPSTEFEHIHTQKIMGEKYYTQTIKPVTLSSPAPKNPVFRF